jgi:type II secretory ATPase GspE/PulE/Tfp pilus assembly ATPase PilB-like protein
MEEKLRLGNMLVESSLLTEEQLRMAMDFQKTVGGKLGAIIVKLGFIEDQTLTNFIARQQGIPVVNLDEIVLPENLVRKIPRKLIEKHHILPIRFHDGVLTVVTSDPFDYEAIEEVQLAADHRIEMQLAPRTQILRSMHEIFTRIDTAPPVKEKSKEELLKDLEEGGSEKLAPAQVQEALVKLLIQKGVITEAELVRKARELETVRER